MTVLKGENRKLQEDEELGVLYTTKPTHVIEVISCHSQGSKDI